MGWVFWNRAFEKMRNTKLLLTYRHSTTGGAADFESAGWQFDPVCRCQGAIGIAPLWFICRTDGRLLEQRGQSLTQGCVKVHSGLPSQSERISKRLRNIGKSRASLSDAGLIDGDNTAPNDSTGQSIAGSTPAALHTPFSGPPQNGSYGSLPKME